MIVAGARPLSPTLLRTAVQSASVAGVAARVSIGVVRHRSPRAHYRVSRGGPGVTSLYRADHVDHNANAVHYGHRRPPGASTTRRPETRPLTGAPGDLTGAHGSTPTASRDASYLERWTPPACASRTAGRVCARQADPKSETRPPRGLRPTPH